VPQPFPGSCDATSLLPLFRRAMTLSWKGSRSTTSWCVHRLCASKIPSLFPFFPLTESALRLSIFSPRFAGISPNGLFVPCRAHSLFPPSFPFFPFHPFQEHSRRPLLSWLSGPCSERYVQFLSFAPAHRPPPPPPSPPSAPAR